MNKKERDRILDFADWAIHLLGFKDWNDGLQFAAGFLERLTQKARSMDTREKLDALLSEMPDESPKVLDASIETTRKLLYQFRGRIIDFSKNELPYPPGGHPQSIPKSEHDEVCDRIVHLQRKRIHLSDAFERVAQQLSRKPWKPVSARTIERIWQNRKKSKT